MRERTPETVIALFAGPGGTCLGAHAHGLRPLGIEWDDAACATRKAAGLPTRQADVAALDPHEFGAVTGLIATPPCQAFSMAGKGAGRDHMPAIVECLRDLAEGRDTRFIHNAACSDDRAMLVVEPLRWTLALKPRWIMLEQVPPVLAIWRVMGEHLRELGYHVWTGCLSAEQYGVPQTRKRAFLIASLDGPVHPPAPTHQRYEPGQPATGTPDGLFGPGLLPWVSMAQALGWGFTERPTLTLTTRESGGGAIGSVLDGGSGSRKAISGAQERGEWLTLGGGEKRPHCVEEDAASVNGLPVSELDGLIVRGAESVDVGGGNDGGGVHDATVAQDFAGTKSADWTLVANAQANAASRPVTAPAPAPTITAGHDSGERVWVHERPATTVNGDPRISEPGHHDPDVSGSQQANAVRVSVREAAILQSFPEDYPWQGSRTAQYRQIGDAVPPLLAAAVIGAIAPTLALDTMREAA